MGSIVGTEGLPDAASPGLILTHPTREEKCATWKMNSQEWRGALSEEQYLAREPYLETVPLSRDGGMRHWVLTQASAESRTVFSSCETLRKRVLVAGPGGGEVKEEIVYGVGSVFTPPAFRGRRYGARMLVDLGTRLAYGCEGEGGRKPIASALWSDIGKTFYAKKGWKPYPSLHVSFAVPTTGADGEGRADETQAITYDNLEDFCQLDEELLRRQLAKPSGDGKTRFAFAPDYDTMRWHLYRDEYIVARVLADRAPSTAKGAVAGTPGRRVWVVWTRNYHDEPAETGKNKLYILRLVFEDPQAGPDDLLGPFAAVMRRAHEFARQWNLGKIDLWNPTPQAAELVKRSGLESELVEREQDSIPSLMWYGEGSVDDVDWVANEKYCWC